MLFDRGMRLVGLAGKALALVVVASCLIGCKTRADVLLIQPGLPHPMDRVRLHSEWAYTSGDHPGLQRLLLIFPLPGAQAGDKQFFVYMLLPEPRPEPIEVGEPLSAGGKVAGFLIQATGRLAGKTRFVKGKIDLKRVGLGGLRQQGTFTIYCEDGTILDGEFIAIVAPLEVTDFEYAKAGDVREILPQTVPLAEEHEGPGPIELGPKPAGATDGR